MQMIGPKPPFPTSTVHTIRLCLFQSTRRPKMVEKIIETSFGKVRIKGRLGQAHLDVFEAICYSRERKKDSEGRIHILVDPWAVRKISGQMSGAQFCSGTTFRRILDDLMQAIIEIIEPSHLACIGHLVDHIDTAVKSSTGEKILRNGPFGERELWTVKLGEAFCRLVQKDVWIGYDPAPIARIGHGISQHVARHILTHRNEPNGGWKLNTLIEATAGKTTSAVLRKYRERIKEDAPRMAEIGIVIEGDHLKVLRENECDTKTRQRDTKTRFSSSNISGAPSGALLKYMGTPLEGCPSISEKKR